MLAMVRRESQQNRQRLGIALPLDQQARVVAPVALAAIQLLQHCPACGRSGIEIDSSLKACECPGYVSQRQVTVSALLMKEAIAWMVLLQPSQNPHRLRRSVQ